MRYTKLMNIIEFHMKIKKNIENIKIPLLTNGNHENLKASMRYTKLIKT